MIFCEERVNWDQERGNMDFLSCWEANIFSREGTPLFNDVSGAVKENLLIVERGIFFLRKVVKDLSYVEFNEVPFELKLIFGACLSTGEKF